MGFKLVNIHVNGTSETKNRKFSSRNYLAEVWSPWNFVYSTRISHVIYKYRVPMIGVTFNVND